MKTTFSMEVLKRAGQKAAWVAKNGTRDEKSGRFLPPAGWKGNLAATSSSNDKSPQKAKTAR
ncbi:MULTISPECIES: hypothetical protein [unclassified Brevundimonas]|uniref:hypothetical protein n=1 Tax=unclassified Brevundimonas TaxID=2622653 RepID=UPI0025C56F07|nr:MULTISPECIES: hypothetical protein [unclassified Brevundimonas]